MIIFVSLLTPFDVNSILTGGSVITWNWIELETKPPWPSVQISDSRGIMTIFDDLVVDLTIQILPIKSKTRDKKMGLREKKDLTSAADIFRWTTDTTDWKCLSFFLRSPFLNRVFQSLSKITKKNWIQIFFYQIVFKFSYLLLELSFYSEHFGICTQPHQHFRSSFLPISLQQKTQKQTVSSEKLQKRL